MSKQKTSSDWLWSLACLGLVIYSLSARCDKRPTPQQQQWERTKKAFQEIGPYLPGSSKRPVDR